MRGMLLVVLGVVGLALTACGSAATAPATTGAASLKVLCTVDEAWCTQQVAAFQTETGIPTTFERKSAGDALSLIRGAAGMPEFSVWWGGASDNYEAAKGDGLLEPYQSPNATNVDSRYKDAAGQWTGIYAGVLAFCSNSEELRKDGVSALTSWDDLLNPKLQGQVSIAHPSTSGTAYTALWTLRTLQGSDDATFTYFDQLQANVVAFTKSGSAPVSVVSEGNAAVGVVFAHDCVSAINKGAQQLGVSFPTEGTGYEIGATAMLKGAPNPDAARRWIDWVLTAKAQEIGAQAGAFQVPLNPDSAVSPLSVQLRDVTLVDYNATEAGAQRTALTTRFEEQIAAAPTE
ncbi:MAG: ABC transporter substrate-binding protein [Actinobacteria bacterium]|nr:ABC transporter substrate-binding protein [Actinomycetota bacterium]